MIFSSEKMRNSGTIEFMNMITRSSESIFNTMCYTDIYLNYYCHRQMSNPKVMEGPDQQFSELFVRVPLSRRYG